MMLPIRGLIVILVASLSLASVGASQVVGKSADTLSGTKYFIVILPTDSANRDNMPIASPEGYVEVDEAPVPLKQVAPVYPSELIPRRIHATVWVKCLISTTGKVLKAEVLKSDSAIFNSAAVEAARQWTFKPAKVKGRPVETWAAIPFRFKGTK